jgi:lysophospholipase L1-like esterase
MRKIYLALLTLPLLAFAANNIVVDEYIAADLNAVAPLMNTDVPRAAWSTENEEIDSSEEDDSYLRANLAIDAIAAVGPNDIVCWGDSLTLYSLHSPEIPYQYPTVLRGLIETNTVGGVTVYNQGVGGETAEQIRTRISADTRHKDAIHIFWIGRNNMGGGGLTTEEQTYIKTALADSISEITSTPKRYLIMSILNGDYGGEYDGETAHTQMLNLWSDLTTLYPSNTLDIRQELIDNATSPGDDTDVTNDVPPSSLRSDSVHLNTAGKAIVAQAVYNFLDAKGWLPAEL